MRQKQKCIVLVHGSWHTGECWSEVATGLRDCGYTVIAPTLPGHGKGLNRNGIAFQDYEAALLNAVKATSDQTVLLGHSSAGVLLQSIAPALPSHVVKLVFLNAFILNDSISLIEAVPPDLAAQFRASAELSKDNSLPVNEDFFRHVILSGVTETVQDRIISQLVPQPFSYYLSAINYDEFLRTQIPKVFLYATDDTSLPDRGYIHMAEGLGQYEQVDLPGGHEVMYTHPEAVVSAVKDLA